MIKGVIYDLNGLLIKKKYQYDGNEKHFIEGSVSTKKGKVIREFYSDFDCIPLTFQSTLFTQRNGMITTLVKLDIEENPKVIEFAHFPSNDSYRVSEELMAHDLIVVQELDRYYLYDYFFEKKLSRGYSNIELNEGHIIVHEPVGTDTLIGELNYSGKLIDGTMTLQRISVPCKVNENDFFGSKSKIARNYDKLIRRRIKQEQNKKRTH